jgi:hypothetical protein
MRITNQSDLILYYKKNYNFIFLKSNRFTKSTSKANFEPTQTEALLTTADAKTYYQIRNSQRV